MGRILRLVRQSDNEAEAYIDLFRIMEELLCMEQF